MNYSRLSMCGYEQRHEPVRLTTPLGVAKPAVTVPDLASVTVIWPDCATVTCWSTSMAVPGGLALGDVAAGNVPGAE